MSHRSVTSRVHDLGPGVGLIALVILAQAADTLTFLAAVPHTGLAAEQNPLVRALYASQGAAGPLAFKAISVVAIVAAMWRIRARFQGPLLVVAGVIALASGLVGVLSNVHALAAAIN